MLRAFLLSKRGSIRYLGRMSPFTFLVELLVPVADWWTTYYDRHIAPSVVGEEVTPIRRVYEAAGELIQMEHADLCAGTGWLAYGAKRFLEGLNREMRVL